MVTAEQGKTSPAAPNRSRASSAIVKNGAISMLALVAVGGTRLVHGSLTSHATDRATYGLVGIMLAASMISSLLLPGGVSSGVSKFVAFYRGAGDLPAAWAAHRFLSRLGLVSSILLGIVTAGVVQHFYQLDLLDTLSLAVLTATYSLYTIDKAAMYGHGLVPQYARIELVTSFLAITATVVMIAIDEAAYLLPLCLGYGLFAVICRHRLRVHRRQHLKDEGGTFDRREALTFSILASIGTLAGAGFLQATQLLAGHFVEPTEVAYFVAAVALVAPLYFLPRAMALALFPAMASAQGAGDRLAVRHQVDVSTRSLAIAMTPVFIIGLISSPLILSLFGGGEYSDGAGVLRLMLCACYFGILQVPSVNALASGSPAHARVPVVAAVVGCVTGLTVMMTLGTSSGAVGVGVGYLIGTAVTATISISMVWRHYRLAWAATLARCTGLVAVTALVTLLSALQDWSWITAAVSAGGLLAAVAMLWVDLKKVLSLLPAGGAE